MESCRNCKNAMKLVLIDDIPEIIKTGKAKPCYFCMVSEEMIPACWFDDPCDAWVKEDD